jgi:hypothetical protein
MARLSRHQTPFAADGNISSPFRANNQQRADAVSHKFHILMSAKCCVPVIVDDETGSVFSVLAMPCRQSTMRENDAVDTG